MPTYVYGCPKCGKEVELVQSITNRTRPFCCESDCNLEMEPIIGATSFILKGSSWARDGYSSKK